MTRKSLFLLTLAAVLAGSLALAGSKSGKSKDKDKDKDKEEGGPVGTA